MLRRIFSFESLNGSVVFAFWMLDSVLDFSREWWVSRPWFSLLRGLPAIVSSLAFLAIVPWHARTLPAEWAARYEQGGNAALQRGNLEMATMCFRRLASLDRASPAANYGLALIAQKHGNLQLARTRMRQVAPETQPGYPLGHFWLAMDLMRWQADFGAQDLDTLEHHLLQSLRRPGNEAEARVSLAWVYEQRGDIDTAIQEIEQVVSQRPALHLNLARLYARSGRSLAARRAASRAGEFFQAKSLAEPGQATNRLFWATSLVLEERFADAVHVLTPGLTWPNPEPFRDALGRLYPHWFRTTTTAENLHCPQQLTLLERVLHYDPINPEVLAILCNLAIREGESGAQAAKLLNGMLERGCAPSFTHLALGIRALHRGESELALIYLRQAWEEAPQLPGLLNNLAWNLARRDNRDLHLALRFAEAALLLAEHPEIRHTRGTILNGLGRTAEALAELEIAVRELPFRAEIHQKLGDLHQQLGNVDLAAEHHHQAANLPLATGDGKQ